MMLIKNFVSYLKCFFQKVFNNKKVEGAFVSAVSGLTSATTYYYRVRASNAGGTSGNSNVVRVTTGLNPPNAPVATTATSVTATGFSANWNAVSTATEYYLDVSVSNTFSSFVTGYKNKSVGNVLTSAVTGLASGTVYYFRVRAANDGGTSGHSNTISVTTALTAPDAPLAAGATAVTSTSFNAGWSEVTGATGYFLDVSTSSTFGTFVTGFNNKDVGNEIFHNVTGMTPGTTYYYRLRAYNAGGTSGNSNIVSVTTGLNPPDTPVATAATSVSTTGFSANWNAVEGATEYYLDVSTDNAFVSMVEEFNNRNVGNVLTTALSGLISGTAYYYRVRASNAGGTSSHSNTITVTTGAVIPDAPVATSPTSVTTTGFSAYWEATPGAAGYYLDVSVSNTFGSFVSGYSGKDLGNVITWPVTGLNPVTTYYYRLRAYNSGGTSSNSNTIAVTTAMTVPDAPVATAATSVSTTGFAANWNASPGAAEYYIDISTTGTFEFFISGYYNNNVGNVLTATISELTPGRMYYYRVRAANTGGISANSNTISVTTGVPVPDPPVAKAATGITKASFFATWNTSEGATGYFLDVSVSSNFSSFVTNYNNRDVGSLLAMQVAGLSPGTTYYYRLRAYNAGGASDNSNVIVVVTGANAPAAPVAIAATSVTITGFTANWNAVSGAKGYFLDVSTSNSFSSFVTDYNGKDVENILTSEVTGLSPCTNYYFRVRAYNAGGTSANSNIIQVIFTNHPPMQLRKIADQTVFPNQMIAILISSVNGHIFSDEDAEDVLTVTAKKEDGTSLPAYIDHVENYLIVNPALADTGCYNVIVKATDLCKDFVTDTFELCVVPQPTTGIRLEDIQHDQLKLYPNPTTGVVRIDPGGWSGKIWLTVYTPLGSTAFTKEYFTDETVMFDLSGHPPGIYLVRISSDDWETFRKVVLNKRE